MARTAGARGDRASTPRLGPWDDLAPELRRALEHPIRRQALRFLHDHEGPRTPQEVGEFVRSAPITQVSYHLLVLEEVGVVRRVNDDVEGLAKGGGRTADGYRRLYVSAVGGDAQVAVLLGLTLEDGADE